MQDPFGIELNNKIERSGVRKVFTPHAPVRIQELLFGRSNLVKQLISQISTPGAFPILFGDRGVGKTSIASIVRVVMLLSSGSKKRTHISMKSCSSNESLASIFKNPLKECGVDVHLLESSHTIESKGNAGLSAVVAKAGISSKRSSTDKHSPVGKNLSPSIVAELLSKHFDSGLLIIDEADAISNEKIKYELSEIIKLLSDAHSNFKVMLVGVAELSESLTAGHKSIGRCAVETKVDRISNEEIQKIITVGATRIKPSMDFDNDVVRKIANMASGYPYFAHLCALKCVEEAIKENRRFIRMHHLPPALKSAALEAEQTLRLAFENATASATIPMYRIVVDAASRFGSETFSAADLRKKVTEISGKDISQAALNNLFKKLVGENHQKILHRVSKGNYRFSDPRMPSFVKMICESQTHYPNK